MYRINNELSAAFQKRYRRAIKPKSCYENVFKMVVGGYPEANMSDWEILFCYLATKNAEPAVIRHVFLLVDGEIVEPLENIREGAILSSIIPISRLTVDSYMTLLLEGKTYACQKLLLEKELQVLRDSHAIINPFEMSDFVFHFAKDNATCLTLLQAASLGDYEPFYQHLLKINKVRSPPQLRPGKRYTKEEGKVSMAVYACNKCGFLFERVSEVTACEDCGSANIRLAEDDEIKELERYKAEFYGSGYETASWEK